MTDDMHCICMLLTLKQFRWCSLLRGDSKEMLARHHHRGCQSHMCGTIVRTHAAEKKLSTLARTAGSS